MTVQADLITRYLSEEDKENANKFESYTKLRGFVADSYIKKWAMDNIYTPDIVEAHKNADFHVHDLSDALVPYCKGHDATKLMTKGLITQTVVAGKPRHLTSFFDQCVNMIAYNQQHWAGAQALSNLNTLAAPYVRKHYDNLVDMGVAVDTAWIMTFNHVKQSVQSFVYNLNFPSRAGSQTPFTNIILNFLCPAMMSDEVVLVPDMDGTWGDYEKEARMILKAFNEVFYEGDTRGRPFTFPVTTINLLPTMDYDDPLWIKLIETQIKFGTYSFFNYDGSGIDPNSILSMCCRLQIDLNELAPTGGRWAYAGETGSIGVITLNMGKLGYQARDKADFYKRLDNLLRLAKNALVMKGIFIEKYKYRFMPFDMTYGTDLTRFFRTIGVVGLHEMCVNFFGKPLSESQGFVLEVLDYMREWTRTAQMETGVLWNLEMTPAEGCSTRMAIKNKEQFGDDIFTQGVEGAYYYTNMITPPNQELTFTERIRAEEDILSKFSGGTVHRIYFGEGYLDANVVAKIVERIAKNTRIPYFDIAPTYSICEKCGTYHPGVVENCGECGGNAVTYDRIVGYYRPRNQANSGKYLEITERRSARLSI